MTIPASIKAGFIRYVLRFNYSLGRHRLARPSDEEVEAQASKLYDFLVEGKKPRKKKAQESSDSDGE